MDPDTFELSVTPHVTSSNNGCKCIRRFMQGNLKSITQVKIPLVFEMIYDNFKEKSHKILFFNEFQIREDRSNYF